MHVRGRMQTPEKPQGGDPGTGRTCTQVHDFAGATVRIQAKPLVQAPASIRSALNSSARNGYPWPPYSLATPFPRHPFVRCGKTCPAPIAACHHVTSADLGR